MRFFGLVVFVLANVACSIPSAQRGSGGSSDGGSVAFFAGRADYDDWAPLDEVDVFGLDFASSSDGLAAEVNLAYGEEDGTLTVPVLGPAAVDIEHFTLGVGARYTWVIDRFRPYLGAGAEGSLADLDATALGLTVSGDDTAVGAYVHAGFQLDLDAEGSVFLGLDYRYGGLGAEYDVVPGVDIDADYQRATAMFGFRF